MVKILQLDKGYLLFLIQSSLGWLIIMEKNLIGEIRITQELNIKPNISALSRKYKKGQAYNQKILFLKKTKNI